MPRTLIQLSIAALACTVLSACDGAGADDEAKRPVASGILSVVVAADRVHYLVKEQDERVSRLILDGEGKTVWKGADGEIAWRTASGSPVEVFGVRNDDGSITVDELRPPEEVTQRAEALTTTGTKRVLALNVTFDGGPANGTNDDVESVLHETAGQLAASSFGRMKLEYDVAGPFDIHFNRCEDFPRWMNEAKAAARSKGIDLARYQHFMLTAPMDCGIAGLGAQGGKETWIAWLGPSYVIHELGHNFGLFHANSRRCKSAGKAAAMSDECTEQDYGDIFDLMGSGWSHQINAAYKANLGWIPPSNVLTASRDGVVTLAPMTSPSDGIQLLRIKGAGGVMYHVELRRPAPTDPFEPSDPAVNGVLIRATLPQAQHGAQTFLLDMKPGGDLLDAALPVGGSYQFFGTSTTLKVESVSSSGARLRISGLGDADPGGDPEGEQLVASHSGKCLSIEGARKDNGGKAVQSPCTGAAAQAWRLERVAGGTFRLKNANSGKCLDVTGRSKERGAAVQQWSCTEGANQKWAVDDNGDGTVSLRSENSGMCLDVSGASTADAARFVQWPCAARANQRFRRQ